MRFLCPGLALVAACANRPTTRDNSQPNASAAARPTPVAVFVGHAASAHATPLPSPPSPPTVKVVTPHHRIAASDFTNCVIDSERRVQCWGFGQSGNLGSGGRGDSPVPVIAEGIDSAVDLCMGNAHACALTDDGSISCWGSNEVGALGNGKAGELEVALRPTRVEGLGKASAVRCGNYHTCALLDGSVQCWGYNAHGGLGDGSKKNRSVPGKVAGLTGVAELGTGWAHTCAVTHGGDVLCWGRNGHQQVADAAASDQTRPYPQKAVAKVVQIALGVQHTCAVRVNGSVHCWGIGTDAFRGDDHALSNVKVKRVALGDRRTLAITEAEKVVGFIGEEEVEIPNLEQAVDIAVGTAHACAITRGGEVACWGRNLYGTLGSTKALASKTPVTIASLKVAPAPK